MAHDPLNHKSRNGLGFAMFIDQALFQKSAMSTIQYKHANISCLSKLVLFGSVRFGSPLPPKIAVLGSVELGWSLVGLPCEVTGQLRGLNQEQTATVPDHCKATKDSAISCNQNPLLKQLLSNLILHSSHNYQSMMAHRSFLPWNANRKGNLWKSLC